MNVISQSYVSKELMHFVGRNKHKEELRYKILISVLNSGLLTSVPQYPETSGLTVIYPDRKLSDNEVYNQDCVCFCDIPVGDIGIHMQKYSKFGISFPKSFLVSKGANPVFYIEKNSDLKLPSIFQGSKKNLTRAEYFDDIHKIFRQVMDNADQLIKDHSRPMKRGKNLKELGRVRHFLENYTFGFLKFFDSKLDDTHNDNYYMEREWLILGNLDFKLGDVHRVILPKSYIRRFRRDVLNYNGQIIFA